MVCHAKFQSSHLDLVWFGYFRTAVSPCQISQFLSWFDLVWFFLATAERWIVNVKYQIAYLFQADWEEGYIRDCNGKSNGGSLDTAIVDMENMPGVH